MKVNSELVRKLRAEQHWSQEQLAGACGLNLRTIQRLESTGNASMETIRALAAVLGVEAKELMSSPADDRTTPFGAVRTAFTEFANFSGTAKRAEYWWFFLFVLLMLAIATIVHPNVYMLAALIVLVPLVAAGTRRLHEAGHSGWWQLLALVPFGIFVVLFMLAMKCRTADGEARTGDPDTA